LHWEEGVKPIRMEKGGLAFLLRNAIWGGNTSREETVRVLPREKFGLGNVYGGGKERGGR